MKKAVFLLIVLTCAQRYSAQLLLQVNKDSTRVWYYQEGDEFNDTTLNTTYWSYHFGWGRSIYPNKEQQYYTDGENHRLENGQLALFAEKKTVTKKLVDWRSEQDSILENGFNYGLNNRAFSFTSGMLQSNKLFRYGYFEIKFTMPATPGFWPAFWLYGCSPNEEIDWMELKTEHKNKLHLGRYSQTRRENFTRKGLFKRAWGEWIKLNGDLSEGFHVVSGEWTSTHLKYYLDGELLAYSPIQMACPKYLVVNLAVPSNNGPFKPGPADSTRNSGDFMIDYIRVWTEQDSLKRQAGKPSAVYAKNTIEQCSMRNTGRATYGPKKLHKKEGITVSIVPVMNGYELCVLGKKIPVARAEVVDDQGKLVQSFTLSYGITVLNLPHATVYRIKTNLYKRELSLRLNQGGVTLE